jgi:hypothetical protein
VINASVKAAKRQKRFVPLDNDEETSQVADWLVDPDLRPELIV